MRAVDTNVLIRYLTADDSRQSAAARRVIDHEHIFVTITVLIEMEWVLRSVYSFELGEIVSALRTLGGHPLISIEHSDRVWRALEWAEQGLDFADALHLAGAEQCAGFISFDRSLVRKAKGLTSIAVTAP
ncbi:MAG: type II toxin-antitoxin system VapC family toxin [Alphaproteobacteria bacterium]|nr:type II toxin-antitoxin system VapC family toxin [Alphaproteobacteria bacterium]